MRNMLPPLQERGIVFQLFSIRTLCALLICPGCFRSSERLTFLEERSERLGLTKQLRTENQRHLCVFSGPFVGTTKIYSSLETPILEEKLVLVVSGYLELYDFTNHNFHNLNKKWKASEIPGIKLVQRFRSLNKLLWKAS